jgi:hypothetical protein
MLSTRRSPRASLLYTIGSRGVTRRPGAKRIKDARQAGLVGGRSRVVTRAATAESTRAGPVAARSFGKAGRAR